MKLKQKRRLQDRHRIDMKTNGLKNKVRLIQCSKLNDLPSDYIGILITIVCLFRLVNCNIQTSLWIRLHNGILIVVMVRRWNEYNLIGQDNCMGHLRKPYLASWDLSRIKLSLLGRILANRTKAYFVVRFNIYYIYCRSVQFPTLVFFS